MAPGGCRPLDQANLGLFYFWLLALYKFICLLTYLADDSGFLEHILLNQTLAVNVDVPFKVLLRADTWRGINGSLIVFTVKALDLRPTSLIQNLLTQQTFAFSQLHHTAVIQQSYFHRPSLFRRVWSYGKEVITCISAPISSPWSTTALGYASGRYRHSGLIYGPIWKQPCDNL